MAHDCKLNIKLAGYYITNCAEMDEFSLPPNMFAVKPYSLLKQEGLLPNFEKIRYDLYNLCVHQCGLGSLWIAYCYQNSKNAPMETDICKQSHWLIENNQDVSKTVSTIRTMRNKIEHGEPIYAIYFRNLVHRIYKSQKIYISRHNPNIIMQQMHVEIRRLACIVVEYQDHMIIPATQLNFSGYCPVCRRRDQKSNEFVATQVDGELKVELKFDNDKLPYGYLLAFKHSHYFDELRGREIKILDGYYADKVVTFIGWNGADSARIQHPDGNIGTIGLVKKIQLLPRTKIMINDAQANMLAHT